MALTLKEQFQIKTVSAYEAADGVKFHDLVDAQGYTRRQMLTAVLQRATKENPQFARLDVELMIALCLHSGQLIGAVMSEPLSPTGAPTAEPPRPEPEFAGTFRERPTKTMSELTAAQRAEPEFARRLREDANDRKVGMPRVMAAPYGEEATGLRQAMSNVDKDLSSEEAEGLDREIIAAMAQ